MPPYPESGDKVIFLAAVPNRGTGAAIAKAYSASQR
jgi:hypothetical protein